MSTISNPDITFNLTTTPESIKNAPQKVLFIGQKLTSGTATPLQVTSVGVNQEEDALFGRSSFLANGIKAFRKINKVSHVDAICLDDLVSGVAATSSISFAGTATADAIWNFSIQSAATYTFTLMIKTGDTAIQIANSAIALINAQTDMIVVAGGASPAVTLTCQHKGTIGNDISLYSETTSAVHVAFATSVTLWDCPAKSEPGDNTSR